MEHILFIGEKRNEIINKISSKIYHLCGEIKHKY